MSGLFWMMWVACTTAPESGDTASNDTPIWPTELSAAAELAELWMGSTSEGAGWTEGELAEVVDTHFNSLTTQNELKWSISSAPGIYDWTVADETMAFAESHGHRVRGHALFWHRLNGKPAWLETELLAAEDPEARARELMAEHVDAMVGRYAGRVESWDVVNEALEEFGPDLDEANGLAMAFDEPLDAIDLAFSLARAADPNARLFLNEIFADSVEAKFEGLVALVTGMKARGVPVDGVGLQAHYVLHSPDGAILAERIAALAALDVDVELTELDISITLFDDAVDPYAAQAEAYREIVGACLSVTRCTGVTTWNVHDGLTWLDTDSLFGALGPHEPTLLDASIQTKPAYDAVVEVLLEGR